MSTLSNHALASSETGRAAISPEQNEDLTLEIAHVLFMDIVGYSKLLIDEQARCLQKLKNIVRGTEEFRRAKPREHLIRLPTGDGMALVFFVDALAPIRCALEVSRALQASPEVKLRIGVHSGPLSRIPDINESENVAGEGIDMAQRVMDCGDAGHILVSSRVADALRRVSGWAEHLYDLGEFEVKHGAKIHIFSLCKDGCGTPYPPQKRSQQRYRNGGVSMMSSVFRYWLILTPIILLLVFGVVRRNYTSQPAVDSALIDSIAVLPFQNKSTEPDTEYLSDGLSNELKYSLTQLPNLNVSPKSLVIRYKGKEVDPVKTGRELRVRAVLMGSLIQRGDNLDISIELVDVQKEQLKWGKRYNRKLSELLATQKEIAREITQELKLELANDEEKALTKRYTASNEAYLLYQKGRFFFGKRTKDDVLRGIYHFKQATDKDQNFALAYVGLANAYNATLAYAYVAPEEALPQAKAAATRALELNPSLAEAHAAFAYSLVISDWNWAESEREFKQALELNPDDDEIHFRYGMVYLMTTGHPQDSDKAIKELKRAVELEPLSLVNNSILASTYLYGRQYKPALEQAKVAYDLEPNFVLARWNLGYAYIVNRMYADAIKLSEQSLQTDPTSQFMLRIAGIAYAKSGRTKDANRVIRRFMELSKTQYVSSYYIASVYAALNEKDKALAELEKSFTKRDWDIHRLKVDPFMDPLRDDVRFEELLKRKLPEQGVSNS